MEEAKYMSVREEKGVVLEQSEGAITPDLYFCNLAAEANIP